MSSAADSAKPAQRRRADAAGLTGRVSLAQARGGGRPEEEAPVTRPGAESLAPSRDREKDRVAGAWR